MLVRVTLLILLGASTLSAQTIQFEDGVFKVTGWNAETPSDLPSIFAVYSGGVDSPPILGTYSIVGDALVFRPRFSIAVGVRYRAVFRPRTGSPLEKVFDVPKPDLAATTRVERVSPSSDVLPGNQLRLYVYFSAPMSQGEWKQRVHLIEQNGKEAVGPFLEVAQELWDPAYRRLTIYFDPGRIKRGLIPNELLGPPLVEGKQYTLVIDPGFLDDRGAPLKEGFKKTFRVGPAIRVQVDPQQWRVTTPKAGTLNPLTIDFPVMMDVALLQHALVVPGVAGAVSIDAGEKRWSFTPAVPWAPGDYQVDIDPVLEDVAGNRIDHVFDVDTAENQSAATATQESSLPFQVKR